MKFQKGKQIDDWLSERICENEKKSDSFNDLLEANDQNLENILDDIYGYSESKRLKRAIHGELPKMIFNADI